MKKDLQRKKKAGSDKGAEERDSSEEKKKVGQVKGLETHTLGKKSKKKKTKANWKNKGGGSIHVQIGTKAGEFALGPSWAMSSRYKRGQEESFEITIKKERLDRKVARSGQ